MTSSRTEIEHTFNFTIGVARSKPLRAPIFPFNSGKWKWSYVPATQTVTLECTGAQNRLEDALVELVTWVEHKPWPERHSVRVGKGGAAFPAAPSSRMSAAVVLPSGAGMKVKGWVGSARLVVVRGEEGGLAGGSAGVVVGLGVTAGMGSGEERAKIGAMAATVTLGTYTPGDVALHFPATDQTLFVNAAALEHASPALKNLIDQAAESDTASSDGRTESLFSFVGGSDDGSDGGRESPSREAAPMPPSTSATPKPGPRPAPSTIDLESLAPDHKRVTIRDASYEMYQAVIVWLLSGYINFAPLVASGPIPPINATAAPAAPAASPSPAGDAASALPSPVLAAVIVQLAITLGLDDLAALALGRYKSQLTVGNVLSQLVRNAHGAERVKQAIMAFAGQHWEEVKRQPMAEELRQPGVLAGMLGGAELGRMLFELASRG